MLPTNVVSFMKKMVTTTEGVNSNQFSSSSAASSSSSNVSAGAGAIGRLRQTLQQAHETVSTQIQQRRASIMPQQIPDIQPPIDVTLQIEENYNIMKALEKENQEDARPGSAGRCRVCVKAMKPDEYKRECTECGLQVCDDCASYSNNADGNEAAWRCSVCRRKGVAIIARGVKPGIEQSEVLEGLGCETIRRSPDTRRLQAGGMNRADSETEVLLLAPKPSDVRRHSDVPLRDILKFQQSSGISAATSQNELALGVTMPTEKAKSSTELMKNNKDGGGGISLSVTPSKDKQSNNKEKSNKAPPSNPKTGTMKRQRSYERGASEGALILPANARGRRSSCDMRASESNNAIMNNNNMPPPSAHGGAKSGATTPSGGGGGMGGLSEKDLIHLQKTHQQSLQQPQQQQPLKSPQHHDRRHSTVPADLAIAGDARRRSVQIHHSSAKQAPQPRSCVSVDAEGIEMKQQQQRGHQQPPPQHNHQQQQQFHGQHQHSSQHSHQHQQHQQHPQHQHQHHQHHEVKRQGSSQDGEAIKIVIDDVDSTAAAIDNNKYQSNEAEFRTRVIRLRRDPQDRGYQTRGFGLRVVGGCNVAGKPGNLRARVARVTPGSGADFAGIRRGDIVLTWNGIKLTNLTFEEVCKVLDTSGDAIEITIASLDSDPPIATVPENGPNAEWGESENLANEVDMVGMNAGRDEYQPASPTRRHLPTRLPTEGRIQLRLFNDEVHNTLEIAVANIAFGNDDCTTIDLNDVIITLRIGDKVANTRWNQCVLFTKVSPEDLFDSWLILELARGPDFLGESHVDMGRVSLDDRPVWFPFSARGSSSHRGSISQIINAGGSTPPGARDIARRLRMRMANAGSQSQSEEQDDSSGQSSPCAGSLLRPEVAWEVLGTLGPPSTNLTSRSAPTSRRGSAQSDLVQIGLQVDDGRGSAPSTPAALPRSLPPSRRGSFAVAVEQVIASGRRGSVAYQQPGIQDMFGRQLPAIPDSGRRASWNPRDVGFDRRGNDQQLRAMQQGQQRRTSEVVQSFQNVVFEARNRARKAQEEESWRQHSPQWGDRP